MPSFRTMTQYLDTLPLELGQCKRLITPIEGPVIEPAKKPKDVRNLHGREHLHLIDGKMVYTPPEPYANGAKSIRPTNSNEQGANADKTLADSALDWLTRNNPEQRESAKRLIQMLKSHYSVVEFSHMGANIAKLIADPQWNIHVPGDRQPMALGVLDVIVMDSYTAKNKHEKSVPGLGVRRGVNGPTRPFPPSTFTDKLGANSSSVTTLFWRPANKSSIGMQLTRPPGSLHEGRLVDEL